MHRPRQGPPRQRHHERPGQRDQRTDGTDEEDGDTHEQHALHLLARGAPHLSDERDTYPTTCSDHPTRPWITPAVRRATPPVTAVSQQGVNRPVRWFSWGNRALAKGS
ncbi:hypothetical protein TNCT6_18420 [Streptomyces sp. 6-11-2]|nr:hypothetical protein TNCT6_18420 [Streptomyces sp. 6-11-2]